MVRFRWILRGVSRGGGVGVGDHRKLKEAIRNQIRELHACSVDNAAEFINGFDQRVESFPIEVGTEIALAVRNPPNETISAVLMAEALREILALREEVANLRAQLGEVSLD